MKNSEILSQTENQSLSVHIDLNSVINFKQSED